MCHIESQWVNEHTDDVHLNKTLNNTLRKYVDICLVR